MDREIGEVVRRSCAAAVLALVLVVVFLMLSTVRCASVPNVPREQARAAVLVVAEAVHAGDESCAAVAGAKKDLVLARYCASAYDDARTALVGASEAVDGWDDARKQASIYCAVASAAMSLSKIVDVLSRRQETVPKVVYDAMAIARMLGGCSVDSGN